MRDAVRANFIAFTERFEGKCAWMYLDQLGLVTTGRGNLIDPEAAAHKLPWRLERGKGALAPAGVVSAEWQRVKGLQNMAKRGGLAFAAVTVLRLLPADIDQLSFAKLDEIWVDLLARFPNLEQWPANAQLALISMSWAMGAHFKFPVFESCAHVQDWAGCALECGMKGVGVAPRNAANQALFNAAAAGGDPSQLHLAPDAA